MINFGSISILLIFASNFISNADAHGYVMTPRSRQWVAAEDGMWSGGADTLPAKENCPSCANTKTENGFCGIVDNRDYDNPLDKVGNPLVPKAQAIYTEGQIIDMEFVFTANHNGHHVTYACPDFNNPTKECFKKYPLEFIEDISVEAYGTDANAPKDPNYPFRGYVNPGASHTKMRFKLPEGLTGDLVLLQWHWVTGNSCRSAGYDTYPYPPGWNPSNMGPCPDDDDLSPIGVGQPEQFWNCMEVKIISESGPTNPIPPSPTPPSPTPPSPTPPSPTPPSPTPPTPSTPAPTVPAPSGNGCCSMNFKNCDSTWCGDTKDQCLSCGTSGDKAWLPNGEQSTCIARWGECTNNPDGCCSPGVCVGDQWYKQCTAPHNAPPTAPAPTAPTPPAPTPPVPTPPAPTSSPTRPVTRAPVTASPTPPPVTPSPIPPGSNTLFSTSNTRSSYDALKELDSLTNIIQASNPPIYALVAEGGAVGSGNVVSEGQGYGIMIAGITLAAMDKSDPNRQDTMNRFYGYFNGWKRMCEISTPKAYCQSEKLCGDGTTACLPGWKHNKDLTEVLGTGAAPDGDEDAIVGMIMAVKAVESDIVKPSWYEEVRIWADASATSFLLYNTKVSKTGNANRIVKLGSCWGGWETEGQNPSYHSPGSYRLMKDYQKEFPSDVRSYVMPFFDDGISTQMRWDRVIQTSYDFLDEAQCDDIGLVPNWGMATETPLGAIEMYPGSFSGSGTPQYEFGSEASRTIWRVLFDVAIYPDDAFQRAETFLNPLQQRLTQGYTGSSWNDNTLIPCNGVNNVFPNWRYNAFIYSPVYSALVLKASGVNVGAQQSMIDTAGLLVNDIPGGLSYYSRCWAIIGIITLNGDIAKAAVNIGISDPTTPIPTPSPSSSITTPAPTENIISTPSPTATTILPSSVPSSVPSSSTLPSTTLTPTADNDDPLGDYSELLELLMALLPLLRTLIDLLNGLSSLFSF